MKRTIIVLIGLFLCLGMAGPAFAQYSEWNPPSDWKQAPTEWQKLVYAFYYPGMTRILVPNGTFSFGPISAKPCSGCTILETSITGYSPQKTPTGEDVAPPDWLGEFSIKIYSKEDSLNPVYTAITTDSMYNPPDWWLIGIKNNIKLPFGKWELMLPVQLEPGEYHLDCILKATNQNLVSVPGMNIMYVWLGLKGSQDFTVEGSLEAPYIGSVEVVPSGESYILNIYGNHFGNTAGSVVLKAGRRSLLTGGELTISSWKNTQITCSVPKNPKAKARRTYKLIVSTKGGSTEHLFRYPPRKRK